jgi:transposase-like protein
MRHPRNADRRNRYGRLGCGVEGQYLSIGQMNAAAIYQTVKLWELLPQRPNDLWQMDVTYIHIPGYGWWYAVTAIDYLSRYLLAACLTDS